MALCYMRNLDIPWQGFGIGSKIMRASRLLGMMFMLQLRGRLPAQALAREFEVSVRTIYRDVDALSAAGVPIYAETGRNGGVSLHEGFRSKLTGLTPSEVAALPIAGLAHVARDLGVTADAASAQIKMLASLPPDGAATAAGIAARFHIDPIPWYHRTEDLAELPALAMAVWRGQQVRVDYESWQGDVRRRLDPLGLVQKGGLWYLVASWRGKPRTYRVANFRALKVLTTPARRPRRFDLAAFWQAAAQRFEAGLLAQRARVRISEEGERILRAVMPAGADMVARTRVACAEAGWSEADLPFETPDYSARQLLRLGREVVVLAPEALRVAVAAEADAVRALYGAPPRRRTARRAPT
jgi:predicted DNA-binding transcriptional regulator YafY